MDVLPGPRRLEIFARTRREAEPSGAERQHGALRRFDVVDADVEVQLLWLFGIGPSWVAPTSRCVGGKLASTLFAADHYPIGAVLVDSVMVPLCTPDKTSTIDVLRRGRGGW